MDGTYQGRVGQIQFIKASFKSDTSFMQQGTHSPICYKWFVVVQFLEKFISFHTITFNRSF